MNKQEKKKLIERGLHYLSDAELLSIIGADNVPAAVEYVKRLQTRERTVNKITRSIDAVDLLRPHYIGTDVEEFHVIYLKRNNDVISVRKIGVGGISSCVVDVRIVLRYAIELGASGIILSHNHPSGERRPSQQDRDITNKIRDAAKLMDIYLLDHVIICQNEYTSFADEGLI